MEQIQLAGPGLSSSRVGLGGWMIDANAKSEIDRIIEQTIADPVSLAFMARPTTLVGPALIGPRNPPPNLHSQPLQENLDEHRTDLDPAQ
jgi:hypothetical protein